MPFLPARNYESEHTRFMREFKARQPEVEEAQREARATWWDRDPRALAEGRTMAEGRVPQRAYVYQPD
jgi:hypothetical protein